MTFAKWNTPRADGLIADTRHLLHTRDGEVPGDGYDRVEYRMRLALAGYDDENPDDPTQSYRDLLTDVLHRCFQEGWDIEDMLRRASQMTQMEKNEWDHIAETNWRLENA